MISLVPYFNNIWNASNGKEHLLFCSKTEYIDASHHSRTIRNNDIVVQWRKHPTTKNLFAQLREQDIYHDTLMQNKLVNNYCT